MPGLGRGAAAGPGRAGPDARCFSSSSNLNINDVLGNYSLTLIDALDTLAVSPRGWGRLPSLSRPGGTRHSGSGARARLWSRRLWLLRLLVRKAPELLPRPVRLNLIRREAREVCVGSWNEQTEFRKLV